MCAVMEKYEKLALRKDHIERIQILLKKGYSKKFILDLDYTEDEYKEAEKELLLK